MASPPAISCASRTRTWSSGRNDEARGGLPAAGGAARAKTGSGLDGHVDAGARLRPRPRTLRRGAGRSRGSVSVPRLHRRAGRAGGAAGGVQRAYNYRALTNIAVEMAEVTDADLPVTRL